MKVIEAENLCYSYGDCNVLDSISFSVEKGDFLAIIGSNGAGKSTLIKLLMGMVESPCGSIKLFGEDIRAFKDWTKIGYIPQDGATAYANFPATVEEIVRANLYSEIGFMRFPKKEHAEKVKAALRLVGMQDCSRRLIGELSGGQRQRVMLARMLVNDPEIMLLDEPATGIDESSTEALYGLLGRLNKESTKTVVMVTHDLERASRYTNRILCIEDGTMVELGYEELLHELRHRHKHPKQRNSTGENGNGNIQL